MLSIENREIIINNIEQQINFPFITIDSWWPIDEKGKNCITQNKSIAKVILVASGCEINPKWSGAKLRPARIIDLLHTNVIELLSRNILHNIICPGDICRQPSGDWGCRTHKYHPSISSEFTCATKGCLSIRPYYSGYNGPTDFYGFIVGKGDDK